MFKASIRQEIQYTLLNSMNGNGSIALVYLQICHEDPHFGINSQDYLS